MAPWADKRIHRAEDIRGFSFDPGFIKVAVPRLARSSTMRVTVAERTHFLDLNGPTLTSPMHEYELG